MAVWLMQSELPLDELRVEMVLREMEDMVVEHTLKEAGPMRSAWDRAVARRRARAVSL
jgi:hypothetical protein